MNDILFWISFVCIFTEIASQEVYEFDANGPCCNGTLGYADVRGKMPCSALKCCDPSETVSVSPVNAALGYVFRCTARSADLEKRCSTQGKLLIDSTNAGTTYGTRICCKGLTIKIYFNHQFAAFAVECVDRFR